MLKEGFIDEWGGYTQLVKQLLDHPQIKVSLQSDFFALSDQERQSFDQIFYTGPLDRYFAYDLGHLEYRSLRFRFTRYQTSAKKPHYQLNSVINFPDAKVAFTRRIEYKWLNPPARPVQHTIVAREYPSSQGEPYYPVPRPVNQRLAAAYLKRVKTLAQQQIYFAGRLATYRYLNMDQAIAEALQLAKKVF